MISLQSLLFRPSRSIGTAPQVKVGGLRVEKTGAWEQLSSGLNAQKKSGFWYAFVGIEWESKEFANWIFQHFLINHRGSWASMGHFP